MKSFALEGSLRTDLGKKAAKVARCQDIIPCVVYGGKETTHFSVSADSVRKLIYSPEIFVVDLSVADKACKAIIKDIQFHPVSDKILHLDFLEISAEKPIVMEVPVKLDGLAEGVKQGGKLSLEMRKLRIKAPYTNVPEQLVINVSALGLGKTIQVGELSFPNLQLMNASNAVVCAVKLTRAARGAKAAAAAKGK